MSTPSQPQRANSAPQPKSRLNYVLDAPLPTPPSFSALSLQDPAPHLPALHPPSHHPAPSLRARSADTALPPIASYPYTRPTPLPSSPHFSHPPTALTSRSPSTSALSDVTPERLPSGILSSPIVVQPNDYTSLSPPTMSPTSPSTASRIPTPTAAPSGKRHKTEAELRDKRELRRMKNRISAARSRQRKTDTFETLQRELGEAKKVIEALTLQLDSARSVTTRQGVVTIAVPHDLRRVVGRDFVSADTLMDLLRYYVAREGGGA